MDKTIITAMMIIAGVVSAVFLFNTVLPAITRSGDAMIAMQSRIDDRLRSQIEIIHATANGNHALMWVKNTGSESIGAIERCDVFFGPENNFSRIPHVDSAAGTPYWEWSVENDTTWKPTATLLITVTNEAILSGRYFVKVATPNGLTDDTYFSK